MSLPEALLRALLRDSTTGKLIACPSGAMEEANQALRDMLAPEVALAPGTDIGAIFAAPDRAEARAVLMQVFADRQPRTVIARLRPAVSDPHHAATITARLLRQEDGQVHALVRVTDITAQRRLEAQLAQGQKLHAVGQLAGGIAHDFNNLLTTISVTTELMLERPTLDAATRDDLADVQRAARRGADLVRQLLAFARRQTLQPRDIDIDAAIADVAVLLRRVLGDPIRLRLDLRAGGRTVHVDPAQFDQVLMNLAINARDAMPDGGTLSLHSGHIHLHRDLARGLERIPAGRYAMIAVRDTGRGIPPDVLPHIFEPFFTTRRDAGGTGLGLATVHGIVHQSGGFLAVESDPDIGTAFRIYLPLAIASAPAQRTPLSDMPVPADPSPGDITGRTLLLVEDEDAVRRVTTRALVRLGWRIHACDSAESALALLDDTPGLVPDLLLSDVLMPGMDGPSLARALRARFPDLPALLVSGHADDRLRDVLQSEKIGFLAKPYSLTDLAGRLRALSLAEAPQRSVPA